MSEIVKTKKIMDCVPGEIKDFKFYKSPKSKSFVDIAAREEQVL